MWQRADAHFRIIFLDQSLAFFFEGEMDQNMGEKIKKNTRKNMQFLHEKHSFLKHGDHAGSLLLTRNMSKSC